jgi:hypothetical protein
LDGQQAHLPFLLTFLLLLAVAAVDLKAVAVAVQADIEQAQHH